MTDCLCHEEERLYREALGEAAAHKDEAVRKRCIDLVHAMHKEIEKVFLPKAACDSCPYRSR